MSASSRGALLPEAGLEPDALAEAVRAGASVKIERLVRTEGVPEAVRVEIGGSG